MPPQRRRAPQARRKRVWARSVGSLTVAAGGSNAVNLLDNFVLAMGGAQPIGCTVSRIRLTAAFNRTSTAANLDALFLGITVGSTNLDPGADIRPLTDSSNDWMYWSKRFVSEESTGTPAGSGPFWDIDVRAMRKIDELGQALWLSYEAQAVLAGTLGFGASVLLLLP